MSGGINCPVTIESRQGTSALTLVALGGLALLATGCEAEEPTVRPVSIQEICDVYRNDFGCCDTIPEKDFIESGADTIATIPTKKGPMNFIFPKDILSLEKIQEFIEIVEWLIENSQMEGYSLNNEDPLTIDVFIGNFPFLSYSQALRSVGDEKIHAVAFVNTKNNVWGSLGVEMCQVYGSANLNRVHAFEDKSEFIRNAIKAQEIVCNTLGFAIQNAAMDYDYDKYRSEVERVNIEGAPIPDPESEDGSIFSESPVGLDNEYIQQNGYYTSRVEYIRFGILDKETYNALVEKIRSIQNTPAEEPSLPTPEPESSVLNDRVLVAASSKAKRSTDEGYLGEAKKRLPEVLYREVCEDFLKDIRWPCFDEV